MEDDVIQVNVKVKKREVAEIDTLAHIDGFDTRSSWVRFHIRKVISSRRNELVSITSLPRPEGGAIVPVITYREVE